MSAKFGPAEKLSEFPAGPNLADMLILHFLFKIAIIFNYFILSSAGMVFPPTS